MLTIVSPETQADRRYGVPRDLNAIPSELAAFKEFAEGRATSLSLASTLFAPILNFRPGDGADRSILSSAWFPRPHPLLECTSADSRLLDTDLCCLRVGLDQLKEPEFLAVLGDLLKRRNHVNRGSGGQSQLTLRSASLTANQLAEARQLLSSTKPWSTVFSETVASLEDLVPSADAIASAREGNRFGGWRFARPEWSRFAWSPPTAHPPAAVPDHLSDAPMRQAFTTGFWCTDFIFEFDGPGPSFGDENRWMLPSRWRMAGAFNTSFIGQPQNALPLVSRRSRDGNLTTFVCADRPVETIVIPSAYDAMRYALARDGAWSVPNAEHGLIRPPNKVVWIAPSNEARYVTGVLGLAAGLKRASQFLLHPFLREAFAELGGTPNLSPDKVTPTVNRLRKRAQLEAVFDLRNEG